MRSAVALYGLAIIGLAIVTNHGIEAQEGGGGPKVDKEAEKGFKRAGPAEKYREAFNMYDTNKNGFIRKAELQVSFGIQCNPLNGSALGPRKF